MRTKRNRSPLAPDSFQSSFLTVSLVHYFAIVLTFATVVFLPVMLQLDDQALPLDQRVEFANQFLSLHQRVWPALLVVLFLLAIHIVYFSHRFAGPLYRCTQIVRQVAQGDLTVSTTTRKGDYLQQEVGELNEMVSALRAIVQDVETQCAQARATSRELEKMLAHGPGPGVSQQLKALNEQLGGLEASLQRFSTGRPMDRSEVDSKRHEAVEADR